MSLAIDKAGQVMVGILDVKVRQKPRQEGDRALHAGRERAWPPSGPAGQRLSCVRPAALDASRCALLASDAAAAALLAPGSPDSRLPPHRAWNFSKLEICHKGRRGKNTQNTPLPDPHFLPRVLEKKEKSHEGGYAYHMQGTQGQAGAHTHELGARAGVSPGLPTPPCRA